MAVLAVLIPPFMLGLLLALGRYEELVLPDKSTERPPPAVAPTEPARLPAGNPAPSPRIPAPSIGVGAPRLLDVPLPAPGPT
ncbi:hypothetical protein [Streptomyces sp. MBT53]|uniref:hypothetical protein n=1 Tax=Streptomyces sp. MBT53 TaxID=1488384 RepID=UPI0019127333|nr:hypothetical protein [Streptomyces sp. MBT53]MBK6014076.1 hypothetical protein [Streptomyces sp. MBT53]